MFYDLVIKSADFCYKFGTRIVVISTILELLDFLFAMLLICLEIFFFRTIYLKRSCLVVLAPNPSNGFVSYLWGLSGSSGRAAKGPTALKPAPVALSLNPNLRSPWGCRWAGVYDSD